jgi:hypothetical protein
MSLFRSRSKKTEPPPSWANFLTAEAYGRFIDLVRAHLQARLGEVTIQDGVATVAGSETRYGLQNLAQLCHMNDRAHWERIIEGHFEAFARSEAERRELDRVIGDYAAVRHLLAVRLWGADHLPAKNPADVFHRQDLEGISSVLVFDLPSTIQPVMTEEASRWGRDLPELFQDALQNVRGSVTPDTSVQKLGENTQVILLSGESHFIATYALLLEDIPDCVGTHGALVAIPHRHALICYPIEDMQVIHAVTSLIPAVYGMHHEGPGQISPNLYWYDRGEFIHLPYKITNRKLQFIPPERFVALLNRLAQSAQT